jgi:hypothetical protein
MEFFVIFSGYNEQVSVISYTCNRQRAFSDSSHKQCVPTSDNSGFEPILHRRGLHRTHWHNINIWNQPHPYFLSPYPSSSSDSEETHNSFDGEIGGLTSLIPVFTTGLIGLLSPPERDLLLLFSFCGLLCFSKRDLPTI